VDAEKVQTEKVKEKCFYLIKTFMRAKTFTDIDLKEGRKSENGFPASYHISLFLSPKSVSAVRLYGDETDIRRLRIFVYPRVDAEKVQTEKAKWKCFYLIKTFMKAKIFQCYLF
jgi:hypothetical protein